MISVNIDLQGDKELIKKLGKMTDLLHDLRGEMKGVSEYLLNFHVTAVFETEGGVFGQRWAPLDPKYDFKKRTTYPGRGILERTGSMRRSYKATSGKDFAAVENTAPYAKYHDSKEPRKVLPRRPLVGLDKVRLAGAGAIIYKGIRGKLRKLFNK